MRSSLRIAFWIILSVVVAATLLPDNPVSISFINDKVEHAGAFFLLATLGAFAWPTRAPLLALSLLAIGGLIEVLQGTHLINRDRDAADWLADGVGVLCGFVIAAGALRQQLRAIR